ncbi:hypothetical protein N657DRAFT_579148 [Parathielavia appendiculata]|uniref:Uncharacterized protein n=1 Tax=Parathielavia appendiculata TaxID=2587402 RepID=A0AAN6TUA3_9PEZI|nr:hypothetical protein N657DRAFT_579148 [Parathielavia appendiculata]
MDGAAKIAHNEAQRILPDNPHHLSLSFDRRFPNPDTWWFTGRSGPLQYMTYLSAGQRGILTTRAAFDISDELPPPMSTKVLAKSEGKKKLSLSDYQNRKKSASPVENGTAAKVEAKPNGIVHAKPAPSREDSKRTDARLEKPRVDINGESRSKTFQTNPQPEAESRKRAANKDNSPLPQKRVKADAGPVETDQPRQRKPEASRGQERTTEKRPKGTSTAFLHPTVNGLPAPSDKERENTASPRSTIQVNGSRPRSDSGTSTPRKSEPLAKAALPQLLSPLHPSIFEAKAEKEATPKKKSTEKTLKPEKDKPKKLLSIPRLLSPTLPPVIEEILSAQNRKSTASKGVSSQTPDQSSDSSGGARKTIVAAPPVRLAEEEEEKPERKSLIVPLKIKNKANVKRVKELLSLPSKSAKDALKKERSTSVEAAPPPAAKKRPRPADDVPQEPAATKRPKPTAEAITAKPPRPTTPLKHAATAMSRVASSQSQTQGNTPAALTGLTPSTSDRPPTRSEPLDPKALAQVESFKERHAENVRLGTKLKHVRDKICRDGGAKLSVADERRVTALHFEMLLAYMMAFGSANQARMLERKVCDVSTWESLLPHLTELRNRVQVQGNKALRALAVQMNVLCLEHITNTFATLDPAAAAGSFVKWCKLNRSRVGMWAEANAAYGEVEDRQMRTLVGPWTSVDDAVVAVLTVMKRWAEREGVRWTPEVTVKGDRDQDRKRERDHDRDRHRDRDRDKDKDRDRDRERDRERDKPRPPLNGSRH